MWLFTQQKGGASSLVHACSFLCSRLCCSVTVSSMEGSEMMPGMNNTTSRCSMMDMPNVSLTLLQLLSCSLCVPIASSTQMSMSMQMSFFFGYQCSLLFSSFNLETPGREYLQGVYVCTVCLYNVCILYRNVWRDFADHCCGCAL